MKWYEIAVHSTRDAVEAISNLLHEAGAGGVVIEDKEDLIKDWNNGYGEVYALNPEDYPDHGVNIKAYLPVNDALISKVDQIKGAINELQLYGINTGAHSVTLSEIGEEEWADEWKKYYKPMRMTPRLTISPTWEDYQPAHPDELLIELDPGMAFGTGTHPTTALCLSMLENYLRQGDDVLDVGTGSGVLSIAAAKLGANTVTAIDLDEVAIRVATENFRQNGVEQQVFLQQNDLVKGLEGNYDVIIANILAEVILKFTHDAFSLLKHGGYFISSGIIKRKHSEVEKILLADGFFIEKTVQDEEWVAIVACKR